MDLAFYLTKPNLQFHQEKKGMIFTICRLRFKNFIKRLPQFSGFQRRFLYFIFLSTNKINKLEY
jgi:hypothetical protein